MAQPSIWQIVGQAVESASVSMADPLVQQQAAEGAVLRAHAAFVAYPLDVLKTQVQSGHPKYSRLSSLPSLMKDYKLRIFRGYPGVGANSFIMGALMFGGYRFFDNFWKLNNVPDYWRPALAGASIGALCGFVATPLEQVKTIMALQESWLKEKKVKARIYTSVLQGAWQAPLRLKFYAATPLIIRTSLFDGQLFFYNSRLREWVAHDGVACSSGTRFFVSTVGFMFAGLIAATVNYPFDRVKGLMMGEAYQASIGEVAQRSTIGTFRSICQKHGILGLFRGLPTRSMLHAVVWCTVGLGREACERLGLRESAKRRSAERGCSRNLTA
ncbi:ucpB [Symbiodinium pilosum]|uniref:UcpB protein n=1 Tax=Symbiodinium pilosum TaxID=2952 RepID=A0A812WA69_SYMPI|nr:ucpB [Symbiodinium pilosum]